MQGLSQMASGNIPSSSSAPPFMPPGMPTLPPWMAAMMPQSNGEAPTHYPQTSSPGPGYSHAAWSGNQSHGQGQWPSSDDSTQHSPEAFTGQAQQGDAHRRDPARGHGMQLHNREHSFRELPLPGGQKHQRRSADADHSAAFSFQQGPQGQVSHPMGPGPSAYPSTHPMQNGEPSQNLAQMGDRDPSLEPPSSGGARKPSDAGLAAAEAEGMLLPGARWVSPEEQWATQQQLQREAAAAGPDMSIGGVPGQMLAVAGQMEPALFGTATSDVSPLHRSAMPTSGDSHDPV